jgi:hypothetical protein
MSQHNIAFVAQESSYLSGLMVVIDTECSVDVPTFWCVFLGDSAKSTVMFLFLKHPVIVGNRQTI